MIDANKGHVNPSALHPTRAGRGDAAVHSETALFVTVKDAEEGGDTDG